MALGCAERCDADSLSCEREIILMHAGDLDDSTALQSWTAAEHKLTHKHTIIKNVKNTQINSVYVYTIHRVSRARLDK